MSSLLLLALGAFSLVATTFALVRVRHPAFLAFPVMMTGWLTGEYPLFHASVQALTALVLVLLGALGTGTGAAGAVLLAASWAGLLRVSRVAGTAASTAETALALGLGHDYRERIDRDRSAILRTSIEPGLTRHPLHNDTTGVTVVRNIAYGSLGTRNLLDLYLPDRQVGHLPAPVVLQIHGGAWIIGNKQQQAQPLLHRLARAGFVCASINYRLGPRCRFPDPIVDVKQAIAWVRANIADHGGDPDVIILTGGSAGGHLAALAALTPGVRALQPGFEDADTSVAGCVPLYGPPDLTDRDAIRGWSASLHPFLARMVMPTRRVDDPELWDLMSPMTHVRADAPPFFVIQGALDVLVWREEQRVFVERLAAESRQPVVYWEVPGAQHAFDTFNSHRSAVAVDAIERFVGWVAANATAWGNATARDEEHQ